MPKSPAKQSRKVDRVDWAKAKTYFLADHTRSLGDVAAHCKANPATIRARAGKELWLQERNTMATAVAKKATERLLAGQIDKVARCNEETLMVARAGRQKAAKMLQGELSPSELSAVMTSAEKAMMQERLALNMSTVNSKVDANVTSREGVLVIGSVMSPEDWEEAARTQQAELTRENAG